MVLRARAEWPGRNWTEGLVNDMAQAETSEQVEMVCPFSTSGGRKKQTGRHWLIGALVILAIIGVLVVEIRSRVNAATNLRTVTSQMAVPSVSVVLPKQTAPAD